MRLLLIQLLILQDICNGISISHIVINYLMLRSMAVSILTTIINKPFTNLLELN